MIRCCSIELTAIRCMRPSSVQAARPNTAARLPLGMGRQGARIAFALGAVAVVTGLIAQAAGLRLNLSTSIPPGVYLVTHDPIARGTIVLACLPPSVSALARARGFVPHGSCADGQAPIGKTVAAVAGDSVTVGPDGVTINGRPLPNSRPLSRDSHGAPLTHVAFGTYVVKPGRVWLMSSYSPRSFDSRYFGDLSDSLILSGARPLLRFH